MRRSKRWLGSMWMIAIVACSGDDGEGDGSLEGSTGTSDDASAEAAPNDADGTDGTGGSEGAEGADGADDDSSAQDSTASADSGVEDTSVGDDDPETTAESDDRADVTDGESPAGTIDVVLSGCSIDFGGEIFVAYNGSLGVASIYQGGGQLSGSFQFDLDGPATFALSTQQRIDTGTIINMVDPSQGTWTNIDPDGAVPDGTDSIGGVLDVSVWDPSEGSTVVEFQGVTLYNTTTGNVCTIDGRVETERLSV